MESPMLRDEDIRLSFVSSGKLSPSAESRISNFSLSLPTSSSVSSELGTLSKKEKSKKGRKRDRDGMTEYDTQSVANFSLSEPSAKKFRRPLSFLSLASFVKDSHKGASKHIKRSFSFSRDPLPPPKYYLPATARKGTPSKRMKIHKAHIPQNWTAVIGEENLQHFSKEDVKRQEAIYSLLRTEMEMVEDLKMVINVFFQPMLRLNLLSAEEHCKIFGNIQNLLPLHEDLVQQLEGLKVDEVIDRVGPVILRWIPCMSPYLDYCANLVTAKNVMEEKKQSPAVVDFLQRCLDSEFSRKIELWTFLDSPRSRLMKYPVLVKEMKRLTPPDHPDQEDLRKALEDLDGFIRRVDSCTGMARCQHVLSQLEYIFDSQKLPQILDSRFIICSGVLRNKSGSKLQAYLFDKAFVLTRPSTRNGPVPSLQVYRNPIPVEYLVVEDVDDGETKVGGSFRGSMSMSSSSECVPAIEQCKAEATKHIFVLSCKDPAITRHSHVLQASSEYDKRLWMDSFRSVLPAVCNPALPNPAACNPALPNPAACNPALPNPAACNPALPNPAACNPALPNPCGSVESMV